MHQFTQFTQSTFTQSKIWPRLIFHQKTLVPFPVANTNKYSGWSYARYLQYQIDKSSVYEINLPKLQYFNLYFYSRINVAFTIPVFQPEPLCTEPMNCIALRLDKWRNLRILKGTGCRHRSTLSRFSIFIMFFRYL